MEGHAQKCDENYCELANKKQSSYTKSQVLAWMITISRKRNLNQLENCQTYAHKLSRNACTWHHLVDLTFYGQWTNVLDQSPGGQELVTIDEVVWFHTFTHTSDYRHYWHLGKNGSALSIGFDQRLRFCWRFWGVKINLGWNLMYLWKSNICTHQLDVLETNVSIPQFYGIGNHFVGCWIATGRITCSWFMGCGDGSVTFVEQYQNTNQIQTQTKGKPTCWSIVACGLRHHKRKFFSRRVSVVHHWRRRSSDQNDH